MKNLIFMLSIFLCASISAQETQLDYQALNQKYQDKVATLDATVKTLYEVISGPKGQERNQELLRYLFHPEGKLVASGKRKNGDYGVRYVTLDDYIQNSLKWMFENGFYENELHRVTDQFGPVAHVFSTYETFYTEEDEAPFMRGMNSIQLMHTGKRWVVLSVYFTQESEENPIPEKYLPND